MMRMQKSCANCCQQFSCSLVIREIIIEVKSSPSSSSSKSQWKSIKVNEALSSVYKLGYLTKLPNISNNNNNKKKSSSSTDGYFDEENTEIAVCGICADLLTNLYKFHEQLTQRRQTNSYVANKIDRLDTFLDEIQRTWTRMVHDGSEEEEEDDDDNNNMEDQFSSSTTSSKMNMKKNNNTKLPIKSSPSRRTLSFKPQQKENIMAKKPVSTIIKFTNNTTTTTTNHHPNSTINEKLIVELKPTNVLKRENIDEDFDVSNSLDPHRLPIEEEEPIIENCEEGVQDDSMDLDKEDDPLASNLEDDESCEDDLEDAEFSTCTLCSKSFLTTAQLAKHLFADHVEPDSKTCPVCFKVFAVSWYMRSHLRTHAGDKPFKCTVAGCKKSFTARCNFQRHLTSSHQHLNVSSDHENVSLSTPKTVSDLTIVASPVLIVHDNKSADGSNDDGSMDDDDFVIASMQCPLCDSEHGTATDLGNHLFYDHTPKDSVDCVVCHRNVHHRGPLKIHILRHVGAITGSGSGGGIKSERLELMKRKNGQMMVQAESAVVSLTTTAAAATVKRARPGRPQKKKMTGQLKKGSLECPTCGLVCHCLSTLQIHMRVHTGEKPFKCKLCDYSCAQSNNMSIHMRVHMKRDKKKGRMNEGDDNDPRSSREESMDGIENNEDDETEELDHPQNLENGELLVNEDEGDETNGIEVEENLTENVPIGGGDTKE